jgi:acyl CoA:acetate/3-ketoacid CoA transferase alpha subunit
MKGPATVLVGGFGFSGVPNTLINAVRDRPDITDLTVVSNNAGMPGAGLGRSPIPSIALQLGQCHSLREYALTQISLHRSIARV